MDTPWGPWGVDLIVGSDHWGGHKNAKGEQQASVDHARNIFWEVDHAEPWYFATL